MGTKRRNACSSIMVRCGTKTLSFMNSMCGLFMTAQTMGLGTFAD
jgi:hypothetical protein